MYNKHRRSYNCIASGGARYDQSEACRRASRSHEHRRFRVSRWIEEAVGKCLRESLWCRHRKILRVARFVSNCKWLRTEVDRSNHTARHQIERAARGVGIGNHVLVDYYEIPEESSIVRGHRRRRAGINILNPAGFLRFDNQSADQPELRLDQLIAGH